ncbi:hypothetical protein KC851_03560 [Candidatus Kaiserbacteria bacterium]|nr:hypothetical protein [Candidatus Kaiserbacteria bacterium]
MSSVKILWFFILVSLPIAVFADRQFDNMALVNINTRCDGVTMVSIMSITREAESKLLYINRRLVLIGRYAEGQLSLINYDDADAEKQLGQTWDDVVNTILLRYKLARLDQSPACEFESDGQVY